MDENLLKIEIFRKYIHENKIKWTNHCLNRLMQRNILIEDVKCAINNGRIIEYYYNDYPYQSCLILGYNINKKIIHIVCGINTECLYMITAYYPDKDMWEKNLMIRR